HIHENCGEQGKDDPDHKTVLKQPRLSISVVAGQQDRAQRRRRQRGQPRDAKRHNNTDQYRGANRYLLSLDRAANEVALNHVVDRVGVDLDARHVAIDGSYTAIAEPMGGCADQDNLSRQFLRRNPAIDDVRNRVVREWIGAAPEIHQHQALVIDRYPLTGDRHSRHAIGIESQYHRRAARIRVGDGDKQGDTVAAVEADYRHLAADFTVGVRVNVEVSKRVGGIVEKHVGRHIRLRLNQIVRLARSLSYDSVTERPGG